jgi:hypothetical protein
VAVRVLVQTFDEPISLACGTSRTVASIATNRNARRDHPLEETLPDGKIVKFYDEAESILAKLTGRGIPMILREVEEGVS